MAGGDPRIVGHVDVARFHILKLKCPRRVFTASAMVLICLACRSRPAPASGPEGRKYLPRYPTLAHDWGKGGVSALDLFLDHGQKPIPHDL